MIVCLCLDDREGLFFNHRRQSRDRAVLQDVGETVGQGRLWVHPLPSPARGAANRDGPTAGPGPLFPPCPGGQPYPGFGGGG